MTSSTTTPTFTKADALIAATAAEDDVRARVHELHERIESEADDAIARAHEYADHLAGGGNPLKYPDTSWSEPSRLIVLVTAMRPVYQAWNRKRGGLHEVEPFRNHAGWRIAEALTAEVGTAVPYERLSRLGGGGGRIASDAVAKAALAIEGPTLVVRRTKVGGKVAFVARERRPDDPESSKVGYAIREEVRP